MKVVYKKTISDKILEAKQEARDQRKQIDYIELTAEEMEQLKLEYLYADWRISYPYIFNFLGIEIRCRQ